MEKRTRKGRGMAVVLLAGLAAAVPGAPASPAAGDARRIPARLVDGRFLVLPVRVNGTGPYPFLLDTGATSTQIDEELADRLRVAAAGEAAWHTPMGVRRSRIVRLSLALGGLECPDTEALVTPLRSLRELDGSLRGVVGQNLLRRGNWWLDYRGRAVVADAEGALRGAGLGEPLPLGWRADRPVIEADLPDGTSLRLVLDSGASSAILFRDVGGGPAGWARLTTHGGATTVKTVTVGPLRMGSMRLPAMVAGLVPEAAEAHPAQDGLLPTALFEGVYLDNHAGTVVLNPKRSRLPATR